MKHEVFISRLLLAYLEEHLSHSVLTVALCNKIVALCQDRSSSLSIKKKIVPKNVTQGQHLSQSFRTLLACFKLYV